MALTKPNFDNNVIACMNFAATHKDAAIIQEHFANICTYVKMHHSIPNPEPSLTFGQTSPEHIDIMKKALEHQKIARKSLDAINEFCLANGIEPICPYDVRQPDAFNMYVDEIAKVVDELSVQ